MTWFVKRAIKASLPRGESVRHFIGNAFSDKNQVAIAATQRRLIIYKKSFLKCNQEEHPWKTLAKVSLDEEKFKGSSIMFEDKEGEEIRIDNIAKRQARNLCGFARQMISEAAKK